MLNSSKSLIIIKCTCLFLRDASGSGGGGRTGGGGGGGGGGAGGAFNMGTLPGNTHPCLNDVQPAE